MVGERLAALDAQAHALDRDIAQRVRRLVVECGASPDVALLAIQEADRNIMAHTAPYTRGRRLRGLRALIGALL